MAFRKRLNQGFHDCEFPPIPRATRSPRRNCSSKKMTMENAPTCAFDLLAIVAGKLLESETTPSCSNTSSEKELFCEEDPLRVEALPQHNRDDALVGSGTAPCFTSKGFKSNNSGISIKLDHGLELGSASYEELEEDELQSENGRGHDSSPLPQDLNAVLPDDDENSFRSPLPTSRETHEHATCLGDRRIRKVLASQFWKQPFSVNDSSPPKFDGDIKHVYHKRKKLYKLERSEVSYPLKKRKLFDSTFLPDSDSGTCNDSYKNINGVSDTPLPSMEEQFILCHPRDSHVKLTIKSFRVPELFIEIPESSTIGSLKKVVMEALMAILGGGSHIGILLKGKKVRDDNKTLLQSGISPLHRLDALAFSIEPNSSTTHFSSDVPFFLPCESSSLPSSRYTNLCERSYATPIRRIFNFSGEVESDPDSAASSPTNSSFDKATQESNALISIPAVNIRALSMIPAHHKTRQSEFAQRRIRRPFTVAEVEALVLAVEKLGTGRWRDVKMRAFDNVKHRTYVDLKDKWKTLVHTARISPQQRRGEPVPQELLDRVLTAHAYWSHQQVKQQLKQHRPETFLLL